MPHFSEPMNLRGSALTLVHAGEPNAAFEVMSQFAPDSPALLLARAGLHLRDARVSEAAALWSDLSKAFTLANTEFAAVTRQLALQADSFAALPMLHCLLTEIDPGTEDWTPAIAHAISNLMPNDPRRERIRKAVQGYQSNGFALATAQRLTGARIEAGELFALLTRAVADGRVGLLPLLFETSTPQSVTELRTALHFYLAHELNTDAAIAGINARGAFVLMQIARVSDPDILSRIANLVRPHFLAATCRDLPRREDVLGRVAHAGTPHKLPYRAQPKLRVAVCVSGRLPSSQRGDTLTNTLRLQAHNVDVFAHVWRTTGGSAETRTLSLADVLDRLPARIASVVAAAAEVVGLAELRRLYPGLTGFAPEQNIIDPQQAGARLNTDHVTVENDALPEVEAFPNSWKTLHATRAAFAMAEASGKMFDLCINLSAEISCSASEDVDWAFMAQQMQDRRVVFADCGFEWNRNIGLKEGCRFAAGSMESMAAFLGASTVGEQVATSRLWIHEISPSRAMDQCLAMQPHLNDISVLPLDFLKIDIELFSRRLQPSSSLALLWQDVRNRNTAAYDSAFMDATLADMTQSGTYGFQHRKKLTSS